MEERIAQLESEVLGLPFMNELLLSKLKITTSDIQSFALTCLDNLEDELKYTNTYYALMGYAYQEKAAEMIKKEREG